MKTREICLIFTSRTVDGGLPEASSQTRSVLQGRLAEGTGGLYLFFTDKIEGTGEADYTVKIGNDEALLRRSGTLPLRQPLFLGKPASGSCELPLGSVPTEAKAKKIEAVWDSDNGTGAANLIYELKLQGQYAGTFDLNFRYSDLKHGKN